MKSEVKQISFEEESTLLSFKTFSDLEQFSPYSQKYASFFRDVPLPNMQQYLKRLQINGVEYNPSKQQKQIMFIKEISASSNYESIALEVDFGPFRFILNLLNKRQRSIIHHCRQIGRGATGHIYQYSFQSRLFVAKCIECPDYNSKKSLLTQIIKEYCFFKICSILEVGPKMNNFMGYDIICYLDCIEFTMQKCSYEVITPQAQKSLKQSLLILHYFHIVHFDIKPDNINFSPFFQKYIFLDFGYTKVINETQGQMKDLFFIGTIGFCCDQMNDAYFSQEKRMIDPYYNDLVGLQRSLIYFKKTSNEHIPSGGNAQSYFHNFSQESNQLSEISIDRNIKEKSSQSASVGPLSNLLKILKTELNFHRFLYEIFSFQHSTFQKTAIQQLLQTHGSKIIQFLLHIYPNQNLKQFYRTYFSGKPQYNSQKLYTHFHRNPLIQLNEQLENTYYDRVSNIFNHDISILTTNTNKIHKNQIQLKEKLIKGKADFVTIQEYFSSFLSFISFNQIHHNDFQEKQEVSQIFIKSEAKEYCTIEEAISKSIVFLINYSLSQPFNRFKQYIFSQSYEQSSILNLYNSREIFDIIQKISTSSIPLHHKFQLFMEVDRCLSWIKARIISENEVDTIDVKVMLSRKTDALLRQSQPSKQSSKAMKPLISYFHMQLYNTSNSQNSVERFQRSYKEVFKVQLNQTQKKWIELIILSKVITFNINQFQMHWIDNFKKFQRFLYQKNQKYYSSFHVILLMYYNSIKSQLDYEKLLLPIKQSLQHEYPNFIFQMRSLNFKSSSFANFEQYIDHLIYLYDQSMKRSIKINEILFHEMIAMKVTYKKKWMRYVNLERYEKLCTRINQYLDLYEQILVQSFSPTKKLFKRFGLENIKYYFIHIILDLETQRFKRILEKIVNELEKPRGEQLEIFQIESIRFAKMILKDVAMVIQIQKGNSATRSSQQKPSFQEIEWAELNAIDKLIQTKNRFGEIRSYSKLIYLFVDLPQKRRLYSYRFYQNIEKYEFTQFYFNATNEFIFYILDGILNNELAEQRQKKLEEIYHLAKNLSQYVYHYYTVRIFVIFLVSFRTFLQRNSAYFDHAISKEFLMKLSSSLNEYPYLGVIIGLLLPFLSSDLKIRALINVAKSMQKLSLVARTSIFKTYLLEMLHEYESQRISIHLQIEYAKRYHCSKMQKRIDKKMSHNKQYEFIAKICRKKVRVYFNNFNNIQMQI